MAFRPVLAPVAIRPKFLALPGDECPDYAADGDGSQDRPAPYLPPRCVEWGGHIFSHHSRSGECLDNAMAESFFATLKAELVGARAWPTRAAARTAIFEWVEVFCNRERTHSALAYRAPVTFEEDVLLLSRHAA